MRLHLVRSLWGVVRSELSLRDEPHSTTVLDLAQPSVSMILKYYGGDASCKVLMMYVPGWVAGARVWGRQATAGCPARAAGHGLRGCGVPGEDSLEDRSE